MNHRSSNHRAPKQSQLSRRGLVASIATGAGVTALVTVLVVGVGERTQVTAAPDAAAVSQAAGLSPAGPAGAGPAGDSPAGAGPAGTPAAGPAGTPVPAAATAGPAGAAAPVNGQRPAVTGSDLRPAVAPAPVQPRTIMVIRHGEKPGDTPGAGIDPAGRPDDHSLTPRGWTRAKNLPRLFTSAGPARPELAQPKAIFAASPTSKGTGQRTRETVSTLSSRLGVPVNTAYGKGQESAMVKAATAQSRKGPVLVCWQHGEIPAIASALNVVGPQPPKSWPDSRYDVVWTFTETPQGWKFSQVPQQLLPGDASQAFK